MRRSRCESPNDPPLVLAWFLDEGGESPVLAAMGRAGVGGALPDGVLRLAEIEDRLGLACAGELDQDPDVFKPVVRDPYVWEMPFTFSGREFRLYLGEPKDAPGYLVALHFHFKDTSGTQDEIRERQNEEIDVASARFEAMRVDRWRMLDAFS